MTDIRDALSSAFEEVENKPEETVEATEAPAPEAVEAAPEPTEAVVAEPAKESKGRDPKGRFVPKAEKTEKEAANGVSRPAVGADAKPDVAGQLGEPTPEVKAPQSWKPAAREEWAKVPSTIQQEVVRRERETAVALQEAAESRKSWSAFQQTVAPFEAMIRAEGSDPIKAVSGLLQTAAALRTAPAAHKAQLVAQMIHSFGVPIDQLDAALAGKSQTTSTQQAPYRDPRVDQMIAAQEAQRAQQEQAARSNAQHEIDTFAANHEFFDDVKPQIAALLESKLAVSLEDAYTKAVKLHPEISGVMAQREAAKAAANAQASTQRSRAAASSIKAAPVGGTQSAQRDDLRSQLEAAFLTTDGR